MTSSTVIGILGVGISLIFGIWGVYLAVTRRYQGRITFVSEQVIGLFDAIVKNIPDLAVLYRKSPVSPNVVLVKGSLINTGTKDISSSMIDRSITLALPSGSNWLSALVVTSSQNVKASVRISEPNVITFDNGLLRRNEFIRFQALAELASARPTKVSLEELLKNWMKFDHRIEDTESVKTFELRPVKGVRRRFRRMLLLLAAGVMSMVVFSVGFRKTGFFNTITCDFSIGNNDSTWVVVREMRTDTFHVRAVEGNFKAAMTPAEFFGRCKGSPTIVPDKKVTITAFLLAFLVYVLFPSIFVCLELRDFWISRKLRKLLALEEETDTHDRRVPSVTAKLLAELDLLSEDRK